ncbi:MAG TPA: DUF433 domain-containing protein [Oceanobacillus sp.]|nr:DUF433 domain-containing protein [Oceanobacillus sp.]
MSVQEIPTQVDLRKYIEVRLFGERPHIRGRRIPVANIVRAMQMNNLSVAETAYNFSISEAEVLAALLYYEEYKEEIERQEEEEARLFEEMKRRYGSD